VVRSAPPCSEQHNARSAWDAALQPASKLIGSATTGRKPRPDCSNASRTMLRQRSGTPASEGRATETPAEHRRDGDDAKFRRLLQDHLKTGCAQQCGIQVETHDRLGRAGGTLQNPQDDPARRDVLQLTQRLTALTIAEDHLIDGAHPQDDGDLAGR